MTKTQLEMWNESILRDVLYACIAYWRGHKAGSDLEARVASGRDSLVMMGATLGHYLIDEPTVSRRAGRSSLIPPSLFWR